MRNLALLLSVLFLAFALATPAYAHGEEHTTAIELFEHPVGPYLLTVWSTREGAGPGEVQFTALVRDAETRAVVTDCAVTLTLTYLDGAAEPQVVEATLTSTSFFDVFVDVPSVGLYQVTVDLRDASGALGRADFDISTQAGGVLFLALVYALAALTLVSIIWFLFEGVRTWGLFPRRAASSKIALPNPNTE